MFAPPRLRPSSARTPLKKTTETKIETKIKASTTPRKPAVPTFKTGGFSKPLTPHHRVVAKKIESKTPVRPHTATTTRSTPLKATSIPVTPPEVFEELETKYHQDEEDESGYGSRQRLLEKEIEAQQKRQREHHKQNLLQAYENPVEQKSIDQLLNEVNQNADRLTKHLEKASVEQDLELQAQLVKRKKEIAAEKQAKLAKLLKQNAENIQNHVTDSKIQEKELKTLVEEFNGFATEDSKLQQHLKDNEIWQEQNKELESKLLETQKKVDGELKVLEKKVKTDQSTLVEDDRKMQKLVEANFKILESLHKLRQRVLHPKNLTQKYASAYAAEKKKMEKAVGLPGHLAHDFPHFMKNVKNQELANPLKTNQTNLLECYVGPYLQHYVDLLGKTNSIGVYGGNGWESRVYFPHFDLKTKEEGDQMFVIPHFGPNNEQKKIRQQMTDLLSDANVTTKTTLLYVPLKVTMKNETRYFFLIVNKITRTIERFSPVAKVKARTLSWLLGSEAIMETYDKLLNSALAKWFNQLDPATGGNVEGTQGWEEKTKIKESWTCFSTNAKTVYEGPVNSSLTNATTVSSTSLLWCVIYANLSLLDINNREPSAFTGGFIWELFKEKEMFLLQFATWMWWKGTEKILNMAQTLARNSGVSTEPICHETFDDLEKQGVILNNIPTLKKEFGQPSVLWRCLDEKKIADPYNHEAVSLQRVAIATTTFLRQTDEKMGNVYENFILTPQREFIDFLYVYGLLTVNGLQPEHRLPFFRVWPTIIADFPNFIETASKNPAFNLMEQYQVLERALFTGPASVLFNFGVSIENRLDWQSIHNWTPATSVKDWKDKQLLQLASYVSTTGNWIKEINFIESIPDETTMPELFVQSLKNEELARFAYDEIHFRVAMFFYGKSANVTNCVVFS
jgi:hypothetical protein